MSDPEFPAAEPANGGVEADKAVQSIVDVEKLNLAPDAGEFPIPVRDFTKKLMRTHDEIWAKLLQLDHAGQAHTETEWREILAAMKQREA